MIEMIKTIAIIPVIAVNNKVISLCFKYFYKIDAR